MLLEAFGLNGSSQYGRLRHSSYMGVHLLDILGSSRPNEHLSYSDMAIACGLAHPLLA